MSDMHAGKGIRNALQILFADFPIFLIQKIPNFQLGYQLPQYIPDEAWEAYHALVDMGFDKQLAK